MRKILCSLINPVSATQADFLPQQMITLNEGKIHTIEPFDVAKHHDYEDYSDCIALPGFIDLHVHLSQYRMRGLYEPSLLPWLKNQVFPEEARSADEVYAYDLSQQFFTALSRAGTTTALIYTAPFKQACKIAFEVAAEMGIRAKIGMTMMDQNAPDDLLQNTVQALDDSFALFAAWQGKNPLLDYIFTPRFAPTCSMDLMNEVGVFAAKHNAWIQTHLSENNDELAWVQELFGFDSYTEVYEHAGLIGQHSILGHAIHLQDRELAILNANKAKIAHCPDSNFYLKSGEFPLQRVENAGIEYGLGSDVGAGTSLNMLYHAKMMNFRQSNLPVLPSAMLYRITLGSAKLLEMDTRIGSLEVGKDADLVFLSPPEGYPIGENTLSQLCFFGEEFSVKETIVAGRTLYKAQTFL
ncbi:MAG: guanine deaminase [Candidatus Cloacimonas sp.]|jgi:guanine deaminase|nr:guanine deaminase [Candidatus Cloacimonas sp.]